MPSRHLTHVFLPLLLSTALGLAACGDDAETCAEGDCGAGAAGPGSPTTVTTTTSSTTAQGGSGGGDAPLSTVVVVQDAHGARHADIPIVVNAADGSIVIESMTDDQGEVEVEIPAGGSVSAFVTFSFWFDGLEYPIRAARTAYPGSAEPARIVLVEGFQLEAPPGTGEMQIGVSYPATIGVAEYQIQGTCFRTTSSTTQAAASMSDCSDDGLYDIVTSSKDAAGVLMDYTVLENQTFEDGGKLNHPMLWSGAGVGNIPYQLSGVPGSAQRVVVSSTATRSTHGASIELRQDVEHVNPPEEDFGGVVSHAVAFGTKHCTEVSVTLFGDDLPYARSVRCSGTPNLTPLVFDPSRLARFRATMTGSTISWTEAATGTVGDVLYLSLDENGVTWSALVDPTVGSVVRPEIPAGLEEYAVDAEDVAGSNIDVVGMTGLRAVLEAGAWDAYETAIDAP